MTLLREIQDAATNAETSVATVLRKCAVLAKRLHHDPLERWVQWELNGYPNDESLPPYRRFETEVRATFVGPFQSGYENVQVPRQLFAAAGVEGLEEFCFTVKLPNPIAEYEESLRHGPDDFKMPLSMEIATGVINGNVIKGYNCLSAWRVLPRTSLVGVVDSVRNKILAFALEIEEENPDAGEASLGEHPVPEPRVQQIFNTTVYGTAAVAGHEATQNVLNVGAGDWDALRRTLLAVGVPDAELESLREALDQDQGEMGPATQGWLGRLAAGAAKGTYSVAAGAGGNLLAEIILRYLGTG